MAYYSVNKIFVIHCRHELDKFHEGSKRNSCHSSNSCQGICKNLLYGALIYYAGSFDRINAA